MATVGDLIAERYELRQRIGRGGFGTVYEAFDSQLNRVVALKLLDKQSKSHNHTQRFRQEAIVAAQIDHPNVVTVYDVGITDRNALFIVMKKLDGKSLGEHLTDVGFIPADKGVPHAIACLEGLAEGHDLGIVHKDLKPANLFLTNIGKRKERMYVIDFGVARLVHDERMTKTGRIVGTPRYLAPEYIETTKVTAQVDVYQMALILVEMLSGHACVPRDLSQLDACERHLNGDLEIPNFIKRSPLGVVLKKALSIDPSNRYIDGNAFAAALRQIDLDALTASQPTIGVSLPEYEAENTVPTRVGKTKRGSPPPAVAIAPLGHEETSDPNPPVVQQHFDDSVSGTKSAIAERASKLVPLFGTTFVLGVTLGAILFFASRGLPGDSKNVQPDTKQTVIETETASIKKQRKITTSPEGAVVRVDNVTQGNAPIELEEGLTATLLADGYEPVSIMVGESDQHIVMVPVAKNELVPVDDDETKKPIDKPTAKKSTGKVSEKKKPRAKKTIEKTAPVEKINEETTTKFEIIE